MKKIIKKGFIRSRYTKTECYLEKTHQPELSTSFLRRTSVRMDSHFFPNLKQAQLKKKCSGKKKAIKVFRDAELCCKLGL